MHKSISWSQVAVLVLQIAVAQSLPIIRPVLPGGQHCCPVEITTLRRKEIRGLDSPASSMLAPLLNYRFLLPELQLRDAVGHHGIAVRLRSFVSELMSGTRPLKIGVLGGSISWGEEATVRGRTDWFSIFTDWLSSVAAASSSKRRVSARNGCVPGTTSTYSLLCLEELVDQDVDLVLVEYGVHDVFADQLIHNSAAMSLERLLRRLMDLPGRPAVVGVAVPRIKTTSFGAFHVTSEDVQGSLSAYYGFPTISLRNALYNLNVQDPTEGFFWNQTFVNAHPGDAGHKVLADLVVHLIQETALGLVWHPVSELEVKRRGEPLAPPMFEGNLPLPTVTRTCLVGTHVQHLAVSATGSWSWVNEGSTTKPRWGFVATTPGSELRLRLDTNDPRVTAAEGTESGESATAAVKPAAIVSILLHYLRSYQTVMGTVLVRCEGGCTCHRQTLDGYLPPHGEEGGGRPGDKERVTQISVAHFKTWRTDSKASSCDLRIRVQNDTSARGHKFKVSGVVVGVGYELEGMYEHKDWRIPDETSGH